jgi:hypothetical protein
MPQGQHPRRDRGSHHARAYRLAMGPTAVDRDLRGRAVGRHWWDACVRPAFRFSGLCSRGRDAGTQEPTATTRWLTGQRADDCKLGGSRRIHCCRDDLRILIVTRRHTTDWTGLLPLFKV